MSSSIYSNASGTLASSNNINFSASYNSVDGYSLKHHNANSADLPSIVMFGFDDYGSQVTMKLAPEPNISSADATKLMMLTLTIINGGNQYFNPLAYVKKQNLERHFTYS